MKTRIFRLSILLIAAFSTTSTAQETQPAPETSPATQPALAVISEMPEFQGIDQWFNSAPLTKASLKGKVVLVDFWTYSCINCLRTLPTLRDWHKKYKTKGLVIVGVHSPEFDFERDPVNVKAAIDKLQIQWPVALDNKMQTWNAYKNQAWPAHYFIDAQGRIRHIHYGEGEYQKSEETIQKLLAERDKSPAMPLTQIPPNVDFSQIKSPETYTGFLRRQRLVTSGRPLELNEWSYEGPWRTEGERIILAEGTGKIRFRFWASKVNVVMNSGAAPASAVVLLDGQPVPKEKAGKDVQGGGVLIGEPRLYELVNLGAKGEEHTLEIQFLNPGVGVYAFTFG